MHSFPIRAGLPKLASMEDEDWRNRAACEGDDPELFFPERGQTLRVEIVQRCRKDCPVQMDCLGSAIARREDHGMWGGYSERARRRMVTMLNRGMTLEAAAAYERSHEHRVALRESA